MSRPVESGVRGGSDGSRAVADAELGVDVLEVLAYGGWGDRESVGDFGVGSSGCELVDDLPLATCEGRDLLVEKEGVASAADDEATPLVEEALWI